MEEMKTDGEEEDEEMDTTDVLHIKLIIIICINYLLYSCFWKI